MTAHLQITLMGGAKITLGGEDLTNNLPAKMRVLLAYLVMEPGDHSRSRLAAWLWDNGALKNLRVNLLKLRRNLPEFLLITDTTIAFNRDTSFDLDVDNFEYTYQLAEKANGAERRAYLRDAIATYQGEFLADLPVDGLLIYDEWITLVRTRLRQKLLSALDLMVDVCLELGDHQTGIKYAQKLLALDDWREKSHRQLMQLYAANGRRDLALRQFEICRQVLADEFGTEPTAVTLHAYERIRSMDDGQTYEVILPRLHGETAVPFEAPIAIAHFTGRDGEMDALGDRLLQTGARNVLALVGLGGIGKTALATMLAHDLRDAFPDGVLWANAATADPMSLAGRWANLFGYDFSQISQLEERAAVLRELLAAKRVLIVFDNVTSPAWVRQFIPEGDRTAVLLTTRNADYAYMLQASVEEIGVLTRENGRLLLTEIIGDRVAAEPEAAAEIYQLRRGLPLAITIAAKQLARRRRRSLSWLVSRLQDETSRIDLADKSGAVRASFAFSWQGLDETQQRIFTMLAVFG
ncbi:MAG: BTAD domain-containing putative transcriptional regulator, partial [Anaerolineae bacterium]